MKLSVLFSLATACDVSSNVNFINYRQELEQIDGLVQHYFELEDMTQRIGYILAFWPSFAYSSLLSVGFEIFGSGSSPDYCIFINPDVEMIQPRMKIRRWKRLILQSEN